MITPLRVLSYGALSPGGIGPQALNEQWHQTDILSGSKNNSHSVCLVDRTLPELKSWEKAPRLRRASPISYFMIEAAQQALAAAPSIDLSRTGVVASFFLGCLLYSVRFYRQIVTEGRRFASPVLFPETVFNSPVSHLVSTLGIGGPVYSQVGDKSCWATALRTAECWLRCGTVDHVLVLGAEEFDPHELDAFRAAGWLKASHLDSNFTPSEGAGALLLTSSAEESNIALTGLVDGYSFLSKKSARHAALECLQQFDDESPILVTATSWTKPIESQLLGSRLFQDELPVQGEAFTATAAWDTIRGLKLLEEGKTNEIIIPYWGLSQQIAAAKFSVIS